MELSLADQTALLPDADRDEVIAGFPPQQLAFNWDFWGRPSQHSPVPDDWHIWLLSAGRGYGKTASEVEWLRTKLQRSPVPLRIALVARTAADVRDTLIQGDAGLLARFPPSEAPTWEPSKRLVTFPDRSIALAFSSEEPSQLRGPAFDVSLCDELASWRWLQDDSGLTAWDNIQIATRRGPNPQLVVGTTPKRLPAIKKLLSDAAAYSKAVAAGPEAVKQLPSSVDRVIVTHGSTADNLGNLSATYINTVYGLFDGTRLARQELEGILLDDVEGALWTFALIDANRIKNNQLPQVPLIHVIGVDPSVADQPTDECGIIVAAATSERDLYRRHLYTLEDRTVHGSPQIWADAVAQAARDYAAPVIAEINQGGALVSSALTNIDPNIRVLPVRARYGKLTRAEPIALAYDQGRVHHLGYLPELEDQLTSWDPQNSRKSPDRLDALVHAATALLINPPSGLYTSPIRAYAPATTRSTSSIRLSTAAALTRAGASALTTTADHSTAYLHPEDNPLSPAFNPFPSRARNRTGRRAARVISAPPPRY